jgi:mono/diheme cytochrome c family protein
MIALALALIAQATTPAPAPVAGPRTAQEIWEKRCVRCHGPDGRGKTKKGRELKTPDLTSPKWQARHSDEKIVKAIANGNRKRKMPAFKDKLSADEIQSLVPHLRALEKK